MSATTATAQKNNPLTDPVRKQLIDQIVVQNKDRPGAIMVVLNEVQSAIGFITTEMQDYIARKLQVPASRVHGVVSFYSFFTTNARGTHTVKFCMGTACYVGGTPALIEKTKQILGIEPGNTTPDGNITVEICRCVGACSQAPVILVDEDVIGRVKPNKMPQVLKPIQEIAE
ncbi:MAG: NAD(P)H-dependent oxidoreductase subunit E [Chloroflexi bacterium HGW-Chloroflexi-5]|jgi:NADH:ubiquinone oxidoreductase subunit E|nr:MAG: NAD(P)H-dependent oxidoreductase subunit E [Chloroflexi bacterium HGW-Chloroflexi-5]